MKDKCPFIGSNDCPPFQGVHYSSSQKLREMLNTSQRDNDNASGTTCWDCHLVHCTDDLKLNAAIYFRE